MSDIDTAAIVATVGTIAALVVIALFLRGKAKSDIRIEYSDKWMCAKCHGMVYVVEPESGHCVSCMAKGIRAVDRIKNISDTGNGVTDERMERIVSAVDDKEE
jgi:hypothetical protein